MVSTNYISDQQISITNNPSSFVTDLRKSGTNGVEVFFVNKSEIVIDFTDKGNRQTPFIYQIIIGQNIATATVNVINNTGSYLVEQTFTTSPAIVEINGYLKSVKIQVKSSLDRRDSVFVNLQVVGCFQNITGCLVDGKKYENRQPLNATINPNECSSKICFCEDHAISCRTNEPSNNCKENEILSCTKPKPDLKCCKCVTNKTAYCSVDYFCNAHCGVCLDGEDKWGNETIVDNATKCNCKDGYQSFIETYEEKKDSETIIHINAKCMSNTVDLSACGTMTTTTTSTTTTKPTQTTTMGTSITSSETSSTTITTTSTQTPTTTITSAKTSPTTTTTTKIGTPTTTTVGTPPPTTTTVSTLPPPTPPTTTTVSTLPPPPTPTTTTVGTPPPTTTTVRTPASTTTTVGTPPPTSASTTASTTVVPTTTITTCQYMFCTVYTCAGECISGEPRDQDCTDLTCTSRLIQVFKNDTYIICARKTESNCGSTSSLTLSQSTSSTKSVPSTSTVLTPPIITPSQITCTYMFCSSYSCSGECITGESRDQDCTDLVCTGRLIQVFKNDTYIICTRKKEDNCGVTLTSTLLTVPPKLCFVTFCAVYTCDKLCVDASTKSEYCSALNCSMGYKEISRNSTNVLCGMSIDINCMTTSTSRIPPSSVFLPVTTTAIPSECKPVIQINLKKYLVEVTKSTNMAGNETDFWITQSTDTVPVLELRFQNTMTIVSIDLTLMSNVKTMKIYLSEDGKTYALTNLYEGKQGQVGLAEWTFTYTKTSILSLKLVIHEKYIDSHKVYFNYRIHGCGKVCSPPMIHTNCSCQQTCDTMADNKGVKVCPSTCVPGCQCPEGMINNNGKCIKIAECPCYYNGRAYAFGDKIPTDDRCKVLVCTKESLQEIPVGNCSNTCKETMKPCPCDGCHKTCDKNNIEANCNLRSCKSGCCCPEGTIFSEVLDKCVKNCPCIYNNRTYEVGEKWQNRCLNCTCDMVKGAYCLENGCDFDQCPDRQKMINVSPNDNICCECVSIDPLCTFNNKDYKVGEIWNDGPCRTFKCVMKNDKASVVTEKMTCPNVTCSASEILVLLQGECCSSCVARNITTTIAPITTTPVSTACQRKSFRTTIELNGCLSKLTVDIGRCEGMCNSATTILYDNNKLVTTKDCKCCFPSLVSIAVEYTCPGNTTASYDSQIISDCGCSKCVN